MKICTSEQEYIDYVVPFAQKVCKRFEQELGHPFYTVSCLVAQSIQENGYGIRSYWDNPGVEALVKYNNMIGIKKNLLNDTWTDIGLGCWDGEAINKKTPEVYGGVPVEIYDDFRIYKDVEQSFADYLCFMRWGGYSINNPKYYPKIKNLRDPSKILKTVHSLGYATGTTYSDRCIAHIKKHNLTKYDDLSKVTPSVYFPDTKKASSSKIVKLPALKINDITASNKGQVPRSRGSNKIQFIVCHYLGVPNADNPYLYGGGYGGHYYVHRNGTVYKAADPKTAVVWHCGGGLQGSGGHEFHGICTNYNSIGIECGVYYTENVKEGDGDSNKWYFSEATQESLVQLVSKLMDEYKISADHVIRHYDVTGKICPNPYVKNNKLKTSWTWTEFKNNLAQYRKDGTITIPDRSSGSVISQAADKVVETAKSYLKKGDTGDAVKTMQKMLIACGYSCGSSGADGDFGNNTLNALKSFQKASGLTVDGLYGVKSKSALESAYKAITAATTASNVAEVFLKAVKSVADMAKANGWKYDDSHATPPCSDKKISCDRLPARALYDLGYTDQPKGGITINNGIDSYLVGKGFKKVTKKADVKAGAIVAVGNSQIEHVFVVESYNPSTDLCRKYDAGSDERIKHGCYYTNIRLCEWANKKFLCAWNVPDNLKGSSTEKKEEQQISGTTFNGVNYSPVYNFTYYKKKYSDLRKAFGNDKDAYFRHFCTYGMKECRQASSKFNVKKYRNRYDDLQKAFGDNWPEYYKHYCIFGKKEGRKAT